MNDGQEKARFLRAWRQKKTDSDLRTSVKGYSVTLALNHALSIWRIISRLRTPVSNNENRKLVKKLGDCASYLVFKHYYTENKGDFAWHENLPPAAIVSVLCAS